MTAKKKGAKKAAAPKAPRRPVEYSQDIADEICERLTEGESLRHICISETMPRKGTVLRWLAESVNFQTQYARAREAQAEYYATQIIEISDGTDSDGDVTRDKLRVDSRKWIASRLLPKKYGDKQQVDLGNTDDKPFKTEASEIDLTDMARKVAFAIALAKADADKQKK